MTRTLSRLAALSIAAILVAACSNSAATPTPAASAAASLPATPSLAATASASAAASATASAAASATPAASPTLACSPDTLKTLKSGTLTIGTDNPAYPPYFQAPATGVKYHSPWKAPLGDPYTGQGFESAVAYAVAGKLGFTNDKVAWTVVPFNNSFKPGAKPFDYYIAQVSYLPERAQAVDMSDGYYFVAQSVVALKTNPIANAKSVADLKNYKFGAQVATTAYNTINDVIQPTTKASVYDTNDAAIAALKAKQIDAIVVDLPTAFYMTAAQLDNGVIVGQFPVQPGPNAEHFSLVLDKGSSLTPCVNQAIAQLKADGTLDQITKEWLADKASAPVFGQ